MNDIRPFRDDPRLTAYALGELAADERPAVEAVLRAHPDLRATVEDIRATAATLEAALANEPIVATTTAAEPAWAAGLNEPHLPSGKSRPAQAPGHSTRDKAARRPTKSRGKLIAFPQFYYIISGLAVAGFAVMVALYRDTFDAKEKLRAANLRLAMENRSAQARATGRDTTMLVTLSPISADGEAAAALEFGATTPDTSSSAFRRENTFVEVELNPLSTFSVDVDTTSYASLRHSIEERQLPPADTVRIEELLNYFSYRYPTPTANAHPDPGTPVAASLEVAEAPWAPTHRLVRIGIKGREVAAGERSAANLVFLIDVSGSMNAPNRLPLVKDSLRLLINELRPDDRVAIVTYAGNSGLALPSTPVAKSREILAALNALTPGGASNGTIGIHLAYDIAKANFVADGMNRVIFCTDGDFNVGPTHAGELVQLVEEKAKANVFLTVLGFGMDNVRDSTLEVLADKGNGHYGYIDSRREAQKLLVDEVVSTLVTIAKDVKVQVEFNPARVSSYRLIGYEDRALSQEDFADDSADASEIGSGHTLTALYEIVPVGAEGELATPAGRSGTAEDYRYQSRRVTPKVPASVAGELLTVKLRYKEPAGDVSKKLEFPLVDRGGRFAAASTDFRFAAAVAEFGMILRGSPNRGSGTLRDVLAWATTSTFNQDDDPGGYRAEFLDLVRKAQALME